MAITKMINSKSDLSFLKKPIGWDLEVKGEPYDVYRIEGYIHTIGGQYGENCYWACPASEIPTYKNLIEFSGDAPTWGVTFDRINHIKSNNWDETEVRANGSCYLTRNGKKFINIPSNDMSYGLATAQHLLVKLLESCPLYLNERNWQEKAIGMKIFYMDQPAIIQHVGSNNELYIVPEDGRFKRPRHSGDIVEWDEYSDGLYVELLSKDIYWFRN